MTPAEMRDMARYLRERTHSPDVVRAHRLGVALAVIEVARDRLERCREVADVRDYLAEKLSELEVADSTIVARLKAEDERRALEWEVAAEREEKAA